MGLIPEWDSFNDSQKKEYACQSIPEHAGVEPSLELLEWLWDSGISAVAGDAISWEVYPTQGELSCHEYLLGGWGMPIGKCFTCGFKFLMIFDSCPIFIRFQTPGFAYHIENWRANPDSVSLTIMSANLSLA